MVSPLRTVTLSIAVALAVAASSLAPGPASAAGPVAPPLSSPAALVPIPGFYGGQVVVSSDGATIYAGRDESGIMAVDATTRREKAHVPIKYDPEPVALSPDGRTLYALAPETFWVGDPKFRPATLTIIDTTSFTIRKTITLPGTVYRAQLSADGSRLGIGYTISPRTPDDHSAGPPSSHVGLIDVAGSGTLRSLPIANADHAGLVRFSADLGSAYLPEAVGGGMMLTRYDLVTCAAPRGVAVPGGGGTFAVSHDGRTGVVSAYVGDAPQLTVYDLPGLTVRGVVPLAGGDSLTFSPDDRTLVDLSSGAPAATLVDLETLGARRVELGVPGASPGQAAFAPDGRIVVTAGGGRPEDLESGISQYWIDGAAGAVTARVPASGWDPAFSPDGHAVYSSVEVYSNGEFSTFLSIVDVDLIDWHPTVSRLDGADRYDVSVAVSKRAFADGADVVFLASGEVFSDALSAATAAARLDAPLLLTRRGSVPASVLSELERLAPARIVVVGGPATIGQSVLDTAKRTGAEVSVIGGANRYENSRALVQEAYPSGTSRIFIATGVTFADALSASSAAHAVDAPVLVINGRAPALDAATRSAIVATGADAFTVVGGPNSVSPGITAELGRLGAVERFSGADRYETSAAVNAAIFPEPTGAYVASGTAFADALSGGVGAAVEGVPIYVARPSCIPGPIAEHLAASAAGEVAILGGPASLDTRAALLAAC
jgi:putative cell wall-binding protein